MKAAATITIGVAAFMLQGCWFVIIPGGAIDAVGDAISGAEGQNCVGGNVKVGDRISAPGGVATVKSLSGPSSRCLDPRYPIRALIDYSALRQTETGAPSGWTPSSDHASLCYRAANLTNEELRNAARQALIDKNLACDGGRAVK